MKVGLKVFKLLVCPSIVKDAVKNLKEIIKYNVDDPGLPDVMAMCVKQHGLVHTVQICFDWLTEIVMPEWTKQLLAGHALTLAECEFPPHKNVK